MRFSSEDEDVSEAEETEVKRAIGGGARFEGAANYFNEKKQRGKVAPRQSAERKRKDVSEEEEHDENVENANSSGKRKKHQGNAKTFGDLNLPSERETRNLVRKLRTGMEKSISEILVDYSRNFSQWWWFLRNGFSILFYGLGSKKRLLELFAESMKHFDRIYKNPAACVLVVNAYSPTFNLRALLARILRDYIGLSIDEQRRLATSVESMGKLILDVTNEIQKSSATRRQFSHEIPSDAPVFTRHLCLLVHNIDGPQARSATVQDVLSTIATSPKVFLVGSVDHVHAPMLWDQRQAERFNWIWKKVNTFEHYAYECIEYPLLQGRDTTTSLGAAFLLSSLTPNHVSILQVLARHQLEANSKGMEFSSLYSTCLDEMFVTNERSLRDLITEFRDHNLVASRVIDGREMLYISLRPDVIRHEILDFKGGIRSIVNV